MFQCENNQETYGSPVKNDRVWRNPPSKTTEVSFKWDVKYVADWYVGGVV